MKTLLFILVVGNLLLLGLAFSPDPDAPGTVVVPPTPPGVHNLQLLSERAEPESEPSAAVNKEDTATKQTETAAAASEEIVQQDTVAAEEPPVPQPACHTIGPFAQKQTATKLAKSLTERNAITAMRQSEIQEPAGFWVYLPAMKRERADEIVDSLVANKIEDYFVGAQNFISLGIYSVRETAQERFEQISALGYSPKLEQRFKVREVFWLDVEEPEPPLLAEQEWTAMLAENPGVRRQNLACE